MVDSAPCSARHHASNCNLFEELRQPHNGPMNVRVRTIPSAGDSNVYIYRRVNYSPGNVVNVQSECIHIHCKGTQYTESEGHPWRFQPSNRRKRLRKGDVGGPFYTERRYALVPPAWPVMSRVVTNPGLPGYRTEESGTSFLPLCLPSSLFTRTVLPNDGGYSLGTVLYSLPPSAFPSLPPQEDLDALGATAISRCKPTKSPADLSTALVELTRDGLPSLVGATTMRDSASALKQAGDEHLNYQFGIKPLVSDVKKTVKTFKNMDNIVTQFERDSGRLVRRRYMFPVESSYKQTIRTTNTTVLGQMANGFGLQGPYPNILVIERHTTIRRWFSGAFTYTLPKGMNSRSILGEIALKADRLGLDPDLETIWNAAPWSWLGDWFSNAGDLISNVNDVAKYGLVIKYGYLMEHIRVAETYSCPNLTYYNSSSAGMRASAPPVTLVTESKRRVPSSPFGFGVDLSSIDGMQASILAALGISRR